MNNLIQKLNFLIKKPKVVVVVGEERAIAAEFVRRILERFKKDCLIFEAESEKIEYFKYFLEKSSLPILIITGTGNISSDIKTITKTMPPNGYLILNFDDEKVKEIKNEFNIKTLTFGFQEGADFRASDINLNTETNFKINHEGDTVPVWLEKPFGKEQIYSALAAVTVGAIFELNLIEISQALKI